MPDLSLNPDIGTQRAPRVSPYPDASLYLDFLTMSANFMDSRITFSRGTNATLTDSTGRITYAPANLVVRSQEFDNAAWGKVNATVTANAVAAPDGTLTADKLVEDVANSPHRVSRFVSASQSVFSVYAKAAERSFIALASGVANEAAWFNLTTGQVGTEQSAAIANIQAVGNGWYRCSIVSTAPTNVQIYVSNADGVDTYTGNGTSGIYIWGAQLEPVTYQTTPSTYVATTSAAYYGPRFDYDPVTLAARGLLIEEARSNLLTYSDALDNTTGWPTATNVTVTANVTASPDGTVNADRLDDGTTAAVQHRLFRSYTFAASAHTYSIYAKAGTGSWFQLVVSDGTTTFYANFNVSTGATGSRHASATSTITNVGNGWYRCTMTATTLAAVGNTQIGMLDTDQGVAVPSYTGANRTLFFYGAQLEAGSFATSYIPTVASTVTRNADVATMTGTNFSSWYNQSEGTFVAEADDPAVGNLYILDANNSTANEEIRLATSATSGAYLVFQGGAVQANIVIGTVAANTPFKIAGAYAANNANAAFNGAVSTTDTSFVSPTVNRLQIGASFTQYLNGHIRTIAYFNTRQPNSQLQTLTT